MIRISHFYNTVRYINLPYQGFIEGFLTINLQFLLLLLLLYYFFGLCENEPTSFHCCYIVNGFRHYVDTGDFTYVIIVKTS